MVLVGNGIISFDGISKKVGVARVVRAIRDRIITLYRVS